jgi:hypothetical protein
MYNIFFVRARTVEIGPELSRVRTRHGLKILAIIVFLSANLSYMHIVTPSAFQGTAQSNSEKKRITTKDEGRSSTLAPEH